MIENKECLCPHCVMELKNDCMSPGFCNPCCVKKNKICPVCKAEYAAEYAECPSCIAVKTFAGK